MSYEDLVDEDLYTDLGDLSQQTDAQGNISSQAQVEVNAGDSKSVAKEITEKNELAGTSAKKINEDAEEKNTEADKEEDDRSSDSDDDDDEAVEIIIGDSVPSSNRKLSRRSSFGHRVSATRNSWKRSDHVVSNSNKNTKKETTVALQDTVLVGDIVSGDKTSDKLEVKDSNKSQRKKTFNNVNSGSNGDISSNNPDGEVYDPLFSVEPWRLKTAFDIDIDALEEKPWRNEHADISDYFNYGNNEEQWINYSKRQDRVRRNLLYKEYIKLKKEDEEKKKQEEEEKALNPVETKPPTSAVPSDNLSGPGMQGVNSSFVTRENRKCYKCFQIGHEARECPNVKDEQRRCFNCGNVGHLGIHCPNPRVDDTNPGRNPNAIVCFKCKETGHLSRDCPNLDKVQCYVCKEFGHISKDCDAAFRQRDRGSGRDGRSQPPPTNRFDRGGDGGGWGGRRGGRESRRYNDSYRSNSRSRGGRDDSYNRNYRSNSRTRGNNYRSNSRNRPNTDVNGRRGDRSDWRNSSRGRDEWRNKDDNGNNNNRNSSRSRSPPERRW
jgi:hypothetical protein